MNPPGKIQLQAPNIGEDIYKPEEHETFNGESGDAHLAKWREFISSGANSTSSSHIKAHSESKSKIIQVHGGRIIRSSGRKDKHSKVCTMRGPKDRRLRLSPKTAIEFYDVQDRLGYDRASKAIDWLMKEAKSAIDALDEQPFLSSNMHTVAEINHSPPIVKTLEITKGTDSSVPGFGFFANETATSSSTDHFQACPDSYQDDFLSALTATHQQIFDTNLETARIQRVFTYANPNSRGGAGFTNSIPPHLPGLLPGFGYSQMFTQREPLQSSINYYSSISTQFPGISFSNEEFSAFNAAQSLKEEEKDKIYSSSTPSFLHYED